PTQPVATRPLAIQKDGTWFCYGWDLTKNICEIFGQNGYIRSTYAYTPFGAVTASGDVEQPIQWSSEYYDNELALVYYNYRHYNPTDGRWINRDPIAEQGGWNLYGFVGNSIINVDSLGKKLLKIIISSSQVPLMFVDNLPETVAGQYNFDFTVVIKKINLANRKVKPQIRYKRIHQSIHINKKLGMDPQKGKHNFVIKGHHQTTEWHERKHAEITINIWNKYVDKINIYEQEISECCYPYYELLAFLTQELALSEIILINSYFDKKYSYEANIDYKILNEKIKIINISNKINLTKQVATQFSCIK
ncbi:MAG: RHS repeat-associated core domain-containing protein, partial [Akkermansia sp.]|nr:RHS repeat-associated core domain-containing protein [Akkermansia sp.]